jgi:hypothetical protein
MLRKAPWSGQPGAGASGCQLDKFGVIATMQPPPTHSKAHRLGCLVAYRRSETNEQLSTAIHRAPWPETVAEQIEALQGIAAAAIIVLAVDDFGLLRMKPQFASREPSIEVGP